MQSHTHKTNENLYYLTCKQVNLNFLTETVCLLISLNYNYSR